MVSGNFKDLPLRTSSDKVLWDKAFNFAKTQKYDEYHHRLGSVIYRFFDKKTYNANKGTGISSDVIFESKQRR